MKQMTSLCLATLIGCVSAPALAQTFFQQTDRPEVVAPPTQPAVALSPADQAAAAKLAVQVQADKAAVDNTLANYRSVSSASRVNTDEVSSANLDVGGVRQAQSEYQLALDTYRHALANYNACISGQASRCRA